MVRQSFSLIFLSFFYYENVVCPFNAVKKLIYLIEILDCCLYLTRINSYLAEVESNRIFVEHNQYLDKSERKVYSIYNAGNALQKHTILKQTTDISRSSSYSMPGVFAFCPMLFSLFFIPSYSISLFLIDFCMVVSLQHTLYCALKKVNI